ncbi:hypothetical protein Aph01nite_00150 [Acrocarpospora phusangensis]|uniref:Uncharacterized protein n=1 Tax=Acrocarpospora phusangensis TaxID=1070424 RepID=A0A919Q6U8_9ACTN|nr:hypothetical protein [Acrocarpospora phusangensis]GIH21705.1 hypothetical protein Aph01nite_00150 [Acrocarpospora phusangensis]
MRRIIGVTSAVILAAGLVAATPDVAEAAAGKKSLKCVKPKGSKFNISWSPGTSSTTFYFNNHCRETHRIKVWATDSASHLTKCVNVAVKPGVKGKKRLWGVIKGNIDMVTFGRCP